MTGQGKERVRADDGDTLYWSMGPTLYRATTDAMFARAPARPDRTVATRSSKFSGLEIADLEADEQPDMVDVLHASPSIYEKPV